MNKTENNNNDNAQSNNFPQGNNNAVIVQSTITNTYLKLFPSYLKFYEKSDIQLTNHTIETIDEDELSELYLNSLNYIEKNYPDFFSNLNPQNKTNMYIQDYINTKSETITNFNDCMSVGSNYETDQDQESTIESVEEESVKSESSDSFSDDSEEQEEELFD